MKRQSGKRNPKSNRGSFDRRQFFAGVGGAAMSFSVMKAGLARGSEANSKISLGMIGCGSRGTWLADLFRKHGGYEVAAAHDYFPERVNAFGDKFGVPAARRFAGLKGYQRMLEAKVDAVAIESPPYFHHEQASAAVRDFVAAQGRRLTLEWLPGYAPELNPVEHIWGYLKEHELPNLCPRELWQLSTAARRALRRMRRRPTLVAAFWKQAELF